MDLSARWRTWWARAGATGDPEPVWRALAAAWGEPHRRYHTREHLADCLARMDEAGTASPAAEMALWFHDAVYDTRAHDIEARSAAWAVDVCRAALLPFAEAVARMILATRDHADRDGEAALVVDVDLSILGRSPAEFDAYEAQVREEYVWVPDDAWRAGRRAVLESFLARPRIYATEAFFRRYEAAARANLARAIARLG